MLERIIIMFCCLLCAFPLSVVSKFDKDGNEPMGFWANGSIGGGVYHWYLVAVSRV